MAGSSMKTAAAVVGYALGGSAILTFVGLFIAGMLILSIIPIYVPDNSVAPYGEIYTIPGFTIKAIYSNVSVNFTGGSVISLQGLSNLCTAIFRAQNVKDFYACVASNFSAYGPTGYTDPSLAIRRRSLNDVALYEVGDMYILFSNPCSNRRALGNWFASLTRYQNSSCVVRRATACRSFITTPNPGGYSNQWYPFSNGYTQLVITNVTGCAAVSISSIYNVYYYNYASIYGRYNITRSSVNAGDCFYSSIVPQTYLAALVNNQSMVNSSVCLSTIG